LKKIPRTLGTPGRMLDGTPVEPPLPKDFDLGTLAGLGTQLEHGGEGEFIVASMDGFLSIDTQTNLIAVTEKDRQPWRRQRAHHRQPSPDL